MTTLLKDELQADFVRRRHSCVYCNSVSGDGRERQRQLQLLALLEHPDALPAEYALRLAREILVRTDQVPAFRCEVLGETRP
jgi:hypothetical protein